ncbi:hypothetical protein [Hydrogenophaga sp.]|uniref:hypothetical protein n=1 Tax=Hydrogenophaga sp. TaxID=1904254 RepID=UPI0025C69575|nr:hypothetical protein [Hydrogenophaga sp.]
MATPNYGYEKRQRELAKKKKKEEKLRAKAAGKPYNEADDAPADDGAQAPGAQPATPGEGGDGTD